MSNETIIKKLKYTNPFNSLRFSENLPEIPKLATSYIESVKNGVLQLQEKKKYYSHIKPIKKTSNSIFSNLNHLSLKTSFNISKIEKINPNKEKRIFNLKIKRKINPIKQNSSKKNSSGLFLTNISTNDDDSTSFIKNYNSLSLSSRINSSNKNKNLPPILKTKNLINSIDKLYNDTNYRFEEFQDHVCDIKKYEKFMINKCDKCFTEIDNKVTIKSDEYLNEGIEMEKYSTMKFNDYFDRLMSDKKDFDYVSLMKMIRNKQKKKKMNRIIQKQKLEKKHKLFDKIIHNTDLELKKTTTLVDSFLNKSQLN